MFWSLLWFFFVSPVDFRERSNRGKLLLWKVFCLCFAGSWNMVETEEQMTIEKNRRKDWKKIDITNHNLSKWNYSCCYVSTYERQRELHWGKSWQGNFISTSTPSARYLNGSRVKEKSCFKANYWKRCTSIEHLRFLRYCAKNSVYTWVVKTDSLKHLKSSYCVI